MLTIGIFGAGGFAREVMSWASKPSETGVADWVFVTRDGGPDVNGYRNLAEREFANLAGVRKFAVAIGNSVRRQEIIERALSYASPISLFAPSCFLGDAVDIGPNAVLSPFTMLTANVRIGDNFQANIYSYVAHDCVLGDHVTLAPGAKINGNVHVGHHAYIGTGAIIRDGTPERPIVIGEGAIVGMGAVVTRSVPAGATVVGNPARPREGS
jgi:sugar O-acyltransferase (sialic acid O-acetyltransferase NeuD family)